MKHIKILFSAFLALFFVTGCGNDDDGSINTATVSVGFEETTYSLKETVDFINIPIVIEDDTPRNGDVIVTATMKSSSVFEPDKDIIITSETLRIPAELNRVNFEVALDVNTPGMDRGRNVEFTITSAQGATVGSNNTCRIDFIEANFVEGTYRIEGAVLIGEGIARGTVWMRASDDSLDDVRMDFGIGTSAKVDFTEIVPGREYDLLIEPFQLIGIYHTYNVYLTWATMTRSETNPDTVEEFRTVYYDRTVPLRGKFTCDVNDEGVPVNQKIIMEDSYALLGIVDGYYNWFDNFQPGAVMTIVD